MALAVAGAVGFALNSRTASGGRRAHAGMAGGKPSRLQDAAPLGVLRHRAGGPKTTIGPQGPYRVVIHCVWPGPPEPQATQPKPTPSPIRTMTLFGGRGPASRMRLRAQ